MQPLPPLDDDWLPAAAHRGLRCGIYLVSRGGLSDYLDGTRPTDLLDRLTTAGRDGRLVGVTAVVRP
jgi:hypothetical protein